MKTKREPSKYAKIRPLWMAVFSDIIGFSILITVLPSFADDLGITPLAVSVISATNGLFSFLSAPIWGKLSDKYGRKKLLNLAQMGTIAGFLLLAFADNYWMLILSRIVDGIFGGNFPIAKAVINDVVEPKDMAKQMTNIGVAHNVANLFGPALGGFLYVNFGLMGPGLAAAFTSVYTLTITFLKLPETAPIKTKSNDLLEPPIKSSSEKRQEKPNLEIDEKTREPWHHNQALVQSLLILAFSSFGFMTIVSNIAMFALKKLSLGPQTMGIYLAGTAVLQILIRYTVYMPALKKLGEYRIALVGFIIYLIEFILFAFVKNEIHFVLMLILNSFATSGTRGSLSAFISNLANPWERGKVQGIASSIDTFAQIIGPLIGGTLLTFLPLEWFTSVSWVFMLIALLILVNSKQLHKSINHVPKKWKSISARNELNPE
ncbi:Multidrug resistance protein MdtG [Candidatus Lokiarchaeum ossiferum]|uniref:Multidrug resistance protein MdtG n=1 Tax=Candidatus Lokiarchaeum ossiferum TaxID=2951803 RepID=A0ABY6HMI4_9ARCH|nr:Multidrug resistance protein MdtG [Candidatus Lokiarchaeum sp. B-35]